MIRDHMKFCILLLSMLAGSVSATDNPDGCVFDSNSITDDFLKENKNIQSYTWSNKDKTAYILLKSGEYVFVKKWACVHYGMEAKKISILPSEEQASITYWQKDMLSFGEQFLSTGNFEAYKSAVEKTDWAQGKDNLEVNDKYQIDIPGFSYPLYYATLERIGDMVITTVYYYMN
ncbi:hypothetical protein Aasi_0440 [Candidatus Amoebophilus asiaticus 5a2]|uniref:Uncharacterized protein n=1 Tax=Amoebophilus asiaticus (strain 5a2) TaxID=452471 RepID=B3ERJ9_AMOA5|nr:hypothetical protein [Candidatus Amoebophilus asiaticus]ACE05851.1 hypothetical protein Aasi_0440 [Candidatus Amoebophilus asiaticus 5a2]